MLEPSSVDDRIPVDQSSVCAELETDPAYRRMKEVEQQKQTAQYVLSLP